MVFPCSLFPVPCSLFPVPFEQFRYPNLNAEQLKQRQKIDSSLYSYHPKSTYTDIIATPISN
ncbi:hypothetical protein [Moorena producens]|uniref:hypothetical protein n=1 Tax=Moorena producens TaxID=1155739 RepID=UPI003C78AA2E